MISVLLVILSINFLDKTSLAASNDDVNARNDEIELSPLFVPENFAFKDFENIRLPHWRAPFPSFGSVWPKPYFIKSSDEFFMLSTANLQFTLVKSNSYDDILKEAMKRYMQIAKSLVGISTYSSNLEHQKPDALSSISSAAKSLANRMPKSAAKVFTRPKDPLNSRSTRVYTNHIIDFIGSFSHTVTACENTKPLCTAYVYVKSDNVPTYPHEKMDESYILSVDEYGIFLYANETWGALRGLETLSQLMWRSQAVDQNAEVYINRTYILDQPRYSYRGLLVDTARHFISKEMLLRNLDAMAYNKLNVFHWHFYDDQAFSIRFDKMPELADAGAYPNGQFYTEKDVKDIIEYARLRGIRVIPETDLPDHTKSLTKSHPEIFAKCMISEFDTDKTNPYTWSGYYGPMHPKDPVTLRFIKDLLLQVAALFPDETVHLGGDEVDQSCWEHLVERHPVESHENGYDPPLPVASTTKESTDSNEKPKKEPSYEDLNTKFHRSLMNIVQEIGHSNEKFQRKVQLWEEVLDNVYPEPDRNAVIQVWKSAASMATDKGFQTIFSTCWYLDHMSTGTEWLKLYKCEPETYEGYNYLDSVRARSSQESLKLIKGGEACMWTEYQNDDTILQRIWPLAMTTAERLWSQKNVRDLLDAGIRLEDHRCRLIGRGVPQGASSGPGSCPLVGAFHSGATETLQKDGPISFPRFASSSNVGHTTSYFFGFTMMLVSITMIIILYWLVKQKLACFNRRPANLLHLLRILVIIWLIFSAMFYLFFKITTEANSQM